jgi:hypothetical protein
MYGLSASLALNLAKVGVNDRAIDDRILRGKQQSFANLCGFD